MTVTPGIVRPDVEQALTRVVAGLRDAAGADLLGVALYGGLAKGRYTPGVSDINILVVLRAAGLPELSRISGTLTAARRESRVVAFVLTPSDLRDAARLFPVKIADIRRAHRILWGEVGLAGIVVDAAALRHRSLQELRNMQFRLRQRAVERGAEPAVLWGGILASLPKLTVTLEILLGDRLAAVRSDRGAVLREAGRELGLTEQIEPFTRLHRTDPRPEDLDVVALAGGYLALLDQLARRLESEGR